MTLERDRRDDGDAALRAVRLDDGGLIIYDPNDEDAWLQSDRSVPFG